MSAVTLVVSGLVSVASGAAFLYVGLRAIPRRVSPENQLARQAFGAYWAALGAYTALAGILDVLAAVGAAPFGFFLAVRLAMLPLLVMSVGGVMFYFLHLFTGDQRWAWPVSMVSAWMLVALAWSVASWQPVGVSVGDWHADLAYRNETHAPWFSLLVLMLALPPILGSFAYLVLAPRLQGEARRRAVMVGAAILLWSLAAVVARLGEDSDLVQLLARPVLGVGAAVIVVRAYMPARAEHPTAADAGLVQRANQLI